MPWEARPAMLTCCKQKMMMTRLILTWPWVVPLQLWPQLGRWTPSVSQTATAIQKPFGRRCKRSPGSGSPPRPLRLNRLSPRSNWRRGRHERGQSWWLLQRRLASDRPSVPHLQRWQALTSQRLAAFQPQWAAAACPRIRRPHWRLCRERCSSSRTRSAQSSNSPAPLSPLRLFRFPRRAVPSTFSLRFILPPSHL